MYLRASLEDLPPELDGLASRVHINFPWGSLLKTVANGEESGLMNIRRICSNAATLEVFFSIDTARDQSEIHRLGLVTLSQSYIEETLVARYQEAGFEILTGRLMTSNADVPVRTSWSRRLLGNAGRTVAHLVARRID